jgi:hypothetical protein
MNVVINLESKKRPVVVTVFSIIIIIIHGALLLCCFVPFGVLEILSSSNLASDYPQNYMPFLYGTMLISAVEIVYGLVAAIGLLLNKSWARFHVVVWAGLSAITSLIFMAVDYGYFGIQWRLDLEGGTIMFVMGILVYVAFFVFYGLIIFFMSRPNVKEYYGR